MLTEPLTRAPVPAWRYDCKGSIVGEPLVWDDVVLIEVADAGGRHGLQAVDLQTGARIGATTTSSRIELAPSLWGRFVVFRSGPDALAEMLIGQKLMVSCGQRRLRAIGPPLRFGNEVFAVVEGRLSCMRMPGFKPIWSSADADCRGQPALRGDTVYIARCTGNTCRLAAFERGSGRPLGLGPELVVRQEVVAPSLVVGSEAVLLHLGVDLAMQSGVAPDTLSSPLSLADDKEQLQLFRLHTLPAVLGGHWWMPVYDPQQQQNRLLLQLPENWLLAGPGQHQELLGSGASPTFAGDVAYLAGAAVDRPTRRLLWQTPARSRAIPARDSLLFADGSTLVCLRAAGDRGSAAATFAATLAAALGAQVEKGLQQLVEQAFAAKDLDFVDVLLQRCRMQGIDENWVRGQEKKRAARTSPRAKTDADLAAAVRTGLDRLDATALAAVWEQNQGLLGDADPDRGLALLRFVLGHDPEHAGAIAAVRKLLPPQLQPPEPFAAIDWLELATVRRAVQVDFIDAKVENVGDQTADQNKLLELRDGWRRDLVALQSPRILVFTPLTTPGSIAHCLSMGELVCDTLEQMFASYPRQRENPYRMRILLYATQQEYLDESRKALGHESAHLAWTGGHYSPTESLARMYLPADQRGFDRVADVFAHELTHQWLQDRCPAFTYTPGGAGSDSPGYWVVEGFASLVEQFQFELDNGRVEVHNPRDSYLDHVRHADAKALLPWDFLLGASSMDMQKLDPRPDQKHRVALGWQLGEVQSMSRVGYFYAQAEALCSYLYLADDGHHRQQLLDYVVAYYTGKRDALDLPRILGKSAAEIGAAVVAFAKSDG